MAAIFLSYRHVDPDQKLASELTNYLARHNISYFVDTQIRISEEWSRVIDREFRACESVAVFLSAESVRSGPMVTRTSRKSCAAKRRICHTAIAGPMLLSIRWCMTLYFPRLPGKRRTTSSLLPIG
jgi:TIR domain